eukprot:scaffold286612_cov15-Tisochrysis_lutea.AAC.1
MSVMRIESWISRIAAFVRNALYQHRDAVHISLLSLDTSLKTRKLFRAMFWGQRDLQLFEQTCLPFLADVGRVGGTHCISTNCQLVTVGPSCNVCWRLLSENWSLF